MASVRFNKSFFSHTLIFLSVLVVLSVWIGSKVVWGGWFNDNWKYVTKLSAFTSTVLMAWTLVLATRWQWLEKIFGGLDQVYQLHKKLGIWSTLLLLAHPITLSFSKFPEFGEVLRYFGIQSWTTQYLIGQNTGWFALVIMIILILLSSQIKIPYHIWKRTHTLFGVVWLLVGAHIFLVGGDTHSYFPLQIVMYWVWFVGVYAFVYRRFLYRFLGPKFQYTIASIEKIESTLELVLTPTKNAMSYLPGQFVYIGFDQKGISKELHPYSIASADEGEGSFKLGIKALGDYTSSLFALKEGVRATVFGPYGRFNESFYRNERPSMCIGGGIGITPFIGMWQHALEQDIESMRLIYCSQDTEDATFINDIERIAIASQFKGFKRAQKQGHVFESFCTDQKGYLTIEELEHRAGGAEYLKNFNFFLCGPRPMTSALITGLQSRGVPQRQIHMEDFTLVTYPKKGILARLFGG